VTWDDIAVFRALGEELSFTRASGRLHVSQSALSQRVRRFEQRLGVRLVDRTSHHVALTPAGRTVLEAAQVMNRAWLHALGDLDGATSPAGRRTVRIGVHDLRPAQIKQALVQLRPDLRWRPVQVPLLSAGMDELSAGRFAALASYRALPARAGQHPGLASAVVVQESIWIRLPTTHRLAAAATVSLADLVDDPWIVRDESEDRKHLTEACERVGFTPKLTHVISDLAKVNDLVTCGEGVVLLSPCSSDIDGTVIRPLAERVTADIVLTWNPGLIDGDTVETALMALRNWYRGLAQARNPAWWRHVVTHPDRYPGLAPGPED
jgi:DNA-binding transcriptional LysR family regulator